MVSLDMLLRYAGVLVFMFVFYKVFTAFFDEDLLWIVVAAVAVIFLVQGKFKKVEIGTPDAGSMRNMGSCRTLSEDAYLVAIFVNDAESAWTEAEIHDFMESRVAEGVAFIEQEAADYGYQLNLGYGYYQENGQSKTVSFDGVVYDGSDDQERYTINESIFEQAAKSLGYGSGSQMMESDRKSTGIRQIGYLICVNKAGDQSYAHPDWDNEYFDRDVEFTVLFSCYPNSTIATPSVGVAHEIMHLFGAEDYYYIPKFGETNKKRSAMAAQLCPDDIMFGESQNIWERSVGRYTAYSIGWLDEIPEEYNKPEWWQ